MLINVALFILAGAAFVGACVEYARSSWHTNDDPMGASMVFTFFWLIGAALISVALVRLAVTTMPWAAGAFVAIIVVGKLVEWFAIEPVLHRMFPAYRRHE